MSLYRKVSFTPEQITAIRESVAGRKPDHERSKRIDAVGALRKRLGRRPTGAEVAAYLAGE